MSSNSTETTPQRAPLATHDADAPTVIGEESLGVATNAAVPAVKPPIDTEGPVNRAGKPKVLIGSQRDPANIYLTPQKPKAVRRAEQPTSESSVTGPLTVAPSASTPRSDVPVVIDPLAHAEVAPVGPDPIAVKPDEPDVVPAPTATDDLGGELDEEVEAALSGVSLDEIIDQHKMTIDAGEDLAEDSRHKATVAKVHRDNVFFTLGGRHQGVASLRQFKRPPKPGAMMDVVVKRFNPEEGLYELIIPGASIDVADWSDLAEGSVIEARITGCNTGGLECMVNTIRGFIPASQISLYHVENLAEFINQKLQCVVMEVNPRRRKLVLSHRAILEREREEKRKAKVEQLQVGQVHEGTVSSLRDFGAFVDLGGVDGLIHISKLSWDHVAHPREVLSEGQQVRVKIEKVNKQTGKIALSYRDLLEHPWDKVEQKYPAGSIVKGTISRIAKFGAFVKFEPGVEGMIHISELAHQRVAAVTNVVQEGQEVEVKVLSVDRGTQRIALSLKATQAQPAPRDDNRSKDQAGVLARELAIPRRQGPLKGGKERSSGGEQFGLNW